MEQSSRPLHDPKAQFPYLGASIYNAYMHRRKTIRLDLNIHHLKERASLKPEKLSCVPWSSRVHVKSERICLRGDHNEGRQAFKVLLSRSQHMMAYDPSRCQGHPDWDSIYLISPYLPISPSTFAKSGVLPFWDRAYDPTIAQSKRVIQTLFRRSLYVV
eukprot:6175208-Pleurochrysis_carterae.AAC.2